MRLLSKCVMLLAGALFCSLAWATPAKWVWVGGAGTADNPGDWATTSNWKWADADGNYTESQPTEGYPSDNTYNGNNAWLPIEITGTAEAPVYIKAGSSNQLEGWLLRMTLSNAHVTIENLGKIQQYENTADTYFHLTNNSTLTIPRVSKESYQWAIGELNVGDGCTFKISEQVTNLNFANWAINLNQTGKLEFVGFNSNISASLSYTIAFNQPFLKKVLKSRVLATWTGETKGLSFNNPTVTTTGLTGKKVDSLNADSDITDIAGGSYNLVEDTTNKQYILYYVDYEADTANTNQAFNQSFDYVFNGLTADYGALSNWTCYNNATLHDTNPPGAPSSDRWGPILVDGKQLINVTVGEDGYKTVTYTDDGDALEGWNIRLGVTNGAHLKVKEIKKFQETAWFYVSKDSKLTVDTFGSQNQSVFGAELHIAAPEGLVVNNEFEKANETPTYTYYLDKEGSVNYKGGLSNSRNHTVAEVILNVGATTNATAIVKRPLILFSSREGTQNFSITADGVTTTSGDTTSAKESEEALAAIGDYCKVEATDGLYIAYVANAVAKIGSTNYASLQAAIDAAGDNATITLVDNVAGAGVTIDKNVTIDFATYTYTVDSGNFALAEGATVTLKNGSLVAGTTTATTLIDNAANLTLSGLIVNGTESTTLAKCLSNTQGTVVIGASSQILAKEDQIAFDVIASATASVNVTVKYAVIEGIIEVSGAKVADQTASLYFGNEYDADLAYHPAGDTKKAELRIAEGSTVAVQKYSDVNLKIPTAYSWKCLEPSALPTEGNATAIHELVAAYNVAKDSNNTEYRTLQDALNNAPTGSTITLLDNIALAQGETPICLNREDVELTLDLNQKQIRANLPMSVIFYLTNGKLNLTGQAGSAIAAGGAYTDGSYAAIAIDPPAELVVDGDIVFYAVKSVIWNRGATVTFNSGTGTSSWGEVVDNSGTFTQNGGAFTSTRSYLYNQAGGTYTMEGGTVVGKSYGVVNNATFNLEGGTISSSAYTLWNSGTANIEGGRIEGPYAVVNNSALTMTDGVIDGAYGVYNNAAAASFEISGGTVNGTAASLGGNASSSGSVTGGTFSSAIPEAWCANGFIPTQNEDGSYGVKVGTYVAQVGTTKYESLQEAIDATDPTAEPAQTVTLIANVALTDGLEVTADDKLTLDLAGYTISYESSETTGNAAITNRGTLTITDTTEGKAGKITYKSTQPSAANAYATNTITNCGTLTVVAGTIENTTASGPSYAIDNNSTSANAVLVIDGGAVTATKVAIRQFANSTTYENSVTLNGGKVSGSRAVYIHLPGSDSTAVAKASLNVTGGELEATGESGGYQLALYSYSFGNAYNGVDITIAGGDITGDLAVGGGSANNGSGAESVKITGGTVEGAVYTYNSKTDDDIAVSGGTFTEEVDEDYCADGYLPESTTDGSGNTVYTVGGPYVAKIGTVGYATLQAAIEAAEAAQTVTLLDDVVMEAKDGETGVVTPIVEITKNLTLDLNGHTISLAEKASVTGIPGVIYISNGANVTIAGEGKIDAECGNNGAYGVHVFNGSVTIKKATVTGAPTAVSVVTGSANIEGGHYELAETCAAANTSTTYLINCVDANYVAKSAGVTITGGSFKNWNPSDNTAEGDYTNFATDGYIGTADAEGNYTLKEGSYVARAAGKQFESLTDAIAAAPVGSTVTLVDNVVMEAKDGTSGVTTPIVKIEKDLTLDLNGKTISLAKKESVKGIPGVIYISNGANVTIAGEGTIDAECGNNGAYGVHVFNGSVTIEAATVTGAPTAVSVVTGSANIEGGHYELAKTCAAANTSTTYLINCVDANYANGDAGVAITGGSFVGWDPSNNSAEGAGTVFTTEEYVGVADGAGNYVVEEKKNVTVLNETGSCVGNYDKPADAVMNAAVGNTIVVEDITAVSGEIPFEATTKGGSATETATDALETADILSGTFEVTSEGNVKTATYAYEFGIAGLVPVVTNGTPTAVLVKAKLTEDGVAVSRTLTDRTLKVYFGTKVVGSVADPVFGADGICEVSVVWSELTKLGASELKITVEKPATKGAE